MFVTAICRLFLFNLKWLKNKSFYTLLWFSHHICTRCNANLSYLIPYSETQGLLVGTMGYFWVSDIFEQKFTLKTDKLQGAFSYRTSSRNVRIPPLWLASKIFFWPISEKVQPGDSDTLLHEVVFLIDGGLLLGPGRFSWRVPEKKKRFNEAEEITSCNMDAG